MAFLCDMRNGCALCGAFKTIFNLLKVARPADEIRRISEVARLYAPPKRAYKPRVKKPAK